MKPHTHFRTVPASGEGGRSPEIKGKFIIKEILKPFVTEYQFDPQSKVDAYFMKTKVEWWAEELPEQAEHENPFCPYCGNFKKMPGNDLIVPLCVCTDWSNQPAPKPTDEDIENAAMDYLNTKELAFHTTQVESIANTAYQAGAKNCRDGKIVKPKNQ